MLRRSSVASVLYARRSGDPVTVLSARDFIRHLHCSSSVRSAGRAGQAAHRYRLAQPCGTFGAHEPRAGYECGPTACGGLRSGSLRWRTDGASAPLEEGARNGVDSRARRARTVR
ncbi:hypothetical protein GTY87_00720 [Streptomyces sp. SID7813]|uniref:Uncharacterized protein n=1 Tax=Streptomyces coelicolor (strain ATCC BAA-471 / A3(2) / M145) TaxID=100226 RepID=Q9RJ04_STRCO|nr:conserved hypothetical protein [Streptomyces lividans TK24]MYU39692.1 hypothetical protein [Streptomyces sp. SID7813]NSL82721.1 hypothetical protein [Streptomyces coelicolor]QFI40465.1 hypothetical protein FQ762_00740 [Streptomyces coelicolor A3(2)]THB00132.1 hypothetical protein E6R61_00170 [Streptomyces sp. LRa12]